MELNTEMREIEGRTDLTDDKPPRIYTILGTTCAAAPQTIPFADIFVLKLVNKSPS